LADAGLAVPDRVERIIGKRSFNCRRVIPAGQTLGWPVESLHRIDTGDHVAVGLKQAEHGFRLEGDIGIDPEQVRERFLRQEFEHDHVAAARDQALAVQMYS